MAANPDCKLCGGTGLIERASHLGGSFRIAEVCDCAFKNLMDDAQTYKDLKVQAKETGVPIITATQKRRKRRGSP